MICSSVNRFFICASFKVFFILHSNYFWHNFRGVVPDDLRRYRINATLVTTAVRNGIALHLGVTLPPIPEPLPLDLPSALLDIEYIEGETPQKSPDDLE